MQLMEFFIWGLNRVSGLEVFFVKRIRKIGTFDYCDRNT
jgi:hypothetical protein